LCYITSPGVLHITAPLVLHHCCIGAASLLQVFCITAPVVLHLCSISVASLLHWSCITAPVVLHHWSSFYDLPWHLMCCISAPNLPWQFSAVMEH
jgi:hypothetical protein